MTGELFMLIMVISAFLPDHLIHNRIVNSGPIPSCVGLMSQLQSLLLNNNKQPIDCGWGPESVKDWDCVFIV